jgi:hypothetical protein
VIDGPSWREHEHKKDVESRQRAKSKKGPKAAKPDPVPKEDVPPTGKEEG